MTAPTDGPAEVDGSVPAVPARAVRTRSHLRPSRPRSVFVRLSEEEYAALADAAGRAGVTVTSYVGVAALAAARGTEAPGSPVREALAELMQARTAVVRVGVAVNKLAAKMLAGATTSRGEVDAAASAARRATVRVESAADLVHRRLG